MIESDIPAVILVGGRGTRLGALSANLPKPLQPIVGDKPFLDYIIDWVASYGVRRVVLLAGYLADQLETRYGAGSLAGVDIEVFKEDEPLGTGGALRNAAALLPETFLMMNGDSIFEFDLASFVAGADDGKIATIALRQIEDASRYGAVTIQGGIVRQFEEKQSVASSGVINAGVYLMRRAILDVIPDGPCSIEADVFPRLAEQGALGGKILDGYFIDIGVPESLAAARQRFAEQGA